MNDEAHEGKKRTARESILEPLQLQLVWMIDLFKVQQRTKLLWFSSSDTEDILKPMSSHLRMTISPRIDEGGIVRTT